MPRKTLRIGVFLCFFAKLHFKKDFSFAIKQRKEEKMEEKKKNLIFKFMKAFEILGTLKIILIIGATILLILEFIDKDAFSLFPICLFVIICAEIYCFTGALVAKNKNSPFILENWKSASNHVAGLIANFLWLFYFFFSMLPIPFFLFFLVSIFNILLAGTHIFFLVPENRKKAVKIIIDSWKK